MPQRKRLTRPQWFLVACIIAHWSPHAFRFGGNIRGSTATFTDTHCGEGGTTFTDLRRRGKREFISRGLGAKLSRRFVRQKGLLGFVRLESLAYVQVAPTTISSHGYLGCPGSLLFVRSQILTLWCGRLDGR